MAHQIEADDQRALDIAIKLAAYFFKGVGFLVSHSLSSEVQNAK